MTSMEYSCQYFDKIIQSAEEAIAVLENVEAEVEKARNVNIGLRSFADGLEEERDDLLETVETYEKRIDELEHRISEYESLIESLTSQIQDLMESAVEDSSS